MTQQSRIENHVEGQLARFLLGPPCKVLWTKAGMVWLKALELPAQARLMLDSELHQFVTGREKSSWPRSTPNR